MTFDSLPLWLFKYLGKINQNVRPDAIVEERPVIIFSHGYAQTPQMFSTIFKELVSFGYNVIAVEHRDHSALHFKSDGGTDAYM